MDVTQYWDELAKAELSFDSRKRELAREYAFSHNILKAGDVVSDGNKTIKISKIKCRMMWDNYKGSPPSMCVYYGVRLNKDGKPNKKGEVESIYQSNIKQ